MPLYWLSLPISWDLADVQAFCTIVLTALSTLFAFIFTRLSWQSAAGRVLRNRSIRLESLLSVNTLGEAYDACLLFGFSIFSPGHWRVLSQCVAVSALAVIAILSGLIVRYSTHVKTESISRTVTGLLANRFHSGSAHATLTWHAIRRQLDAANFPQDRLLDFLPTSPESWTFSPSDWDNSTWSMDCDYTEETPVSLTVVDFPCDENTTMTDQIPALDEIFPETALRADPSSFPYTELEGYQDEDTFAWTNMLVFRTSFTFPQQVNWSEISESLDVTLGSIYMEGLPGVSPSGGSSCTYSPGPVESARYTKVFCKIRKTQPTPAGLFYADIAYPDSGALQYLGKAYIEYFMERFIQVIADNEAHGKAGPVAPKDLVRFYQVYTISQDTLSRHIIERSIHVPISVVQVSMIFLVLGALLALLCLVGSLKYGLFWLRHGTESRDIPQSKIDWMAQAVPRKSSPSGLSISEMSSIGRKKSCFSSEAVLSPPLASRSRSRRQSGFEMARYSSSGSGNTPPQGRGLSSWNSSGYFPLLQTTPQASYSDVNLWERQSERQML